MKREKTIAASIVVRPDERIQLLSDKFTKLVVWKGKLQTREKELFSKCVSAQLEGDSKKAMMYDNQCAEVRKMIRLVAGTEETISKLLDQCIFIVWRLEEHPSVSSFSCGIGDEEPLSCLSLTSRPRGPS
jgi:hypothetical protein